MLRKTLVVITLGIALVGALIGASHLFAARLERANVLERSASRGLASEIRQLAASDAPVWITWEAPVADPDSQMCCYTSIDSGEKNNWRGGRCTLGSKGGSSFMGSNDAVPPITRTTFSIFAKAEKGRVAEIRMFSEDCVVDAAGATVHRIAGVQPADSIVWLLAYAENEEPRSKKDSHHATAAIAMHRAPQAIDALERLVTSGKSDGVRAHAAFWLGHRGGSRGRQILRGVIDQADSHEIVDQAIAGIAQDKDQAATDLLLTMAKTHRFSQVRKQSIFWLGQRAGEKATAHLKEAADDPDEDVREMAVFSISQLPKDRAIPELIQLARTHKSRKVRERAIFWLGQSGDPRALEFIEEILTK